MDDLPDDFGVFLLGHRADARPRTVMDVVIQAGALIGAGDGFTARAQRENTLQDFKRRAKRADIRKRAEITVVALLVTPGNVQARPFLTEVDHEIRV